MSMRKTWAAPLLLGAIVFSANAAAKSEFRKLVGKEIAAEFAGMELTDESHWGEVFQRNGRLVVTSMGHKVLASGACKKINCVLTPELSQEAAVMKCGLQGTKWS